MKRVQKINEHRSRMERREEKKINSLFSYQSKGKRKKIISHNFKFTPVQIIANEQCGAPECPCSVAV